MSKSLVVVGGTAWTLVLAAAVALAVSVSGGCARPSADGGGGPPGTDAGGGGPVGGCNDGLDDDGDGRVDYPVDPGCADPGDADEVDDCPDGPSCPACSNGLDDDGDGRTDWALGGAGGDPGCYAASDGDETDVSACTNGIDDDGDGFVDFPVDPACDDEADEDEREEECRNGQDDDGDGLVDFPADPDCTDARDDQEEGPPACADGVENDGDGLADFPADPGCDDAEDADEFDPPDCAGVTVDDLRGGEASGTTVSGAPSVFSSSCGGAAAPEGIGWLEVPARLSRLQIDSYGSAYATVVYMLPACDPAAVALGCVTGPLLEVEDVEPGGYWVFADGANDTATGAWELSFQGTIAPGQPCTPGDTLFRCPTGSGFACTEVVPGAGSVCTNGPCSDGQDNDGDGLADWPSEPGCLTPADADETDPAVPPLCSNGADDDGDSLFDWPVDPGCESRADDEELEECVPGLPLQPFPATGNATGATSGPSFFTPSCQPSSMAPEAAYTFEVPAQLDLIVSTANAGTSYNATLELRGPGCETAADSLGCAATISHYETITLPAAPPGEYHAIIDGSWTGFGTYELSIQGTLPDGGACDPAWATRWRCATGAVCAPDAASGTGWACREALCSNGTDDDGDGVADWPAEPGCATGADDDEANPAPAPLCANGADDDGDALADWPADIGCRGASGAAEACAVFGVPAGAATGAGGYVGCSEAPVVMPCDDISATGIPMEDDLGDDGLVTVPLPFNFDYFGVSRDTATVAANGKIGFPAAEDTYDWCLSGLSSPMTNQTIFAYWDDLYPPTGNVRWQILGTPGARRFVVQWVVEHYPSSPEAIDVRAMLHEGTNDITICYVDTSFGTSDDAGASASAGIRGTGASQVLQWSCAPAAGITPGLVLRYRHE